METLYYDCLTHIFPHLTKKDVYHLAQINKYYHNTLQTRQTWQTIVQKEKKLKHKLKLKPLYHLTKVEKDGRISEYSYFKNADAFQSYLIKCRDFRKLVCDSIFWNKGTRLNVYQKDDINLIIEFLENKQIQTRLSTYIFKKEI